MSSLTIQGTTSGSCTLQAPAVAGTSTLTLPSGNVRLLGTKLDPGTTTVSPLTFTSGTNLTTATAGTLEYDGKAFYATPSGALRGIIPGLQYYRNNSTLAYAVGSGTSSVFGVGVTLASSTVYIMEGQLTFQRSVAASHFCNMGFGGTATLNSILWQGRNIWQTGLIPLVDSSAEYSICTTASMTQIVSSASTQTLAVFLRGTVSVNSGGTFIPQFSQSAATAFYTLQIGSYFAIYPIGASGANISVGSWA
jgi:hypothetical protein